MSHAKPKLYLLDVEGTVAPLTLTSEVLFPYARAHFSDFLEEYVDDPAVRADLEMLSQENLRETAADSPKIRHPAFPAIPPMAGAPGLDSETWESDDPNSARHPERPLAERGGVEGPAFRDAVLAYLLWLMDRDRKSTALKSLQGKIWKAGFESGELKGTLFDDVPDAFKRWSADARVAIYSSGSVDAQKLLFRHSVFGDLTPWIGGYFDTRTGPKMEPASYAAIAATMDLTPPDLQFFSDSVRELDAAREAGCQTRLVVRPGNAPVHFEQGDAHRHSVVESFADL